VPASRNRRLTDGARPEKDNFVLGHCAEMRKGIGGNLGPDFWKLAALSYLNKDLVCVLCLILGVIALPHDLPENGR
jgi:hypothetical protein